MICFLITNVNNYAHFSLLYQIYKQTKSTFDRERTLLLIDKLLRFCKSASHTFQVPTFIPQ